MSRYLEAWRRLRRGLMTKDVMSVLDRARLSAGSDWQAGRMYLPDISRQIALLRGSRSRSRSRNPFRFASDIHVALAHLERSGWVRTAWDEAVPAGVPQRRWYESADPLVTGELKWPEVQ